MQVLINGTISGLTIAVLAIGFQSVYLPTRVFFIGLAGVYSLAPFLMHAMLQMGTSGLVAAIAGIALSAVVAIFCELLNHGPLARKGAGEGTQLITSLGIYIVLVQTITLIWGNEALTLRTGNDSVTLIGSAVVTATQLLTLIVNLSVLVAFAAVLRATNVGLKLRALADNPSQFALLGYNVAAYRTLAFAFAGTLTAIGALLAAYDNGFDPYVGLAAVLVAVVAVVVGGRTSFLGPVIAAILLGVTRAAVTWYISARWADAVTFGLLALFLLFRPQGLVQQVTRVENKAGAT
jgi:branched-chain amino acid transport system permease protein